MIGGDSSWELIDRWVDTYCNTLAPYVCSKAASSVSCPVGSLSPADRFTTSLTDCICPADTYLIVDGAQARCEPCGAGRKSPAGSKAESDCVYCEDAQSRVFLAGGVSRCYRYFSSINKRWRDAQTACVDWGGNLVSIKSAGEHKFVMDLAGLFTDPKGVWIGLNYRGSTFRDWKWANGSVLAEGNYLNWLPGQPDSTRPGEYWCCQECGMVGGDPSWELIDGWVDHYCSALAP